MDKKAIIIRALERQLEQEQKRAESIRNTIENNATSTNLNGYCETLIGWINTLQQSIARMENIRGQISIAKEILEDE